MSDETHQAEKVPTTYERLSAPFAVSEHATVNKGGGDQTYAPWTEYTERLNDVLGVHNWSFRVIREGFTETECWVLGEITATIDGVETTRQQYGCEPIVKGREAKPTTDLLKSTASDALKKAASLIGPGLYLSIKEERVAIQAAMRAAVQEAAKEAREASKTPAQPAAPTPINKPRDAAVPRSATPKTLACAECGTAVDSAGTVKIMRNAEGQTANVTVSSFEPVCRERLGAFYCGPCYDKKYWKAG